MRRVVVTGIGIVSSIGNNASEVLTSLKEGRSGLSFAPEYAEKGFRCHVHGKPDLDPVDHIDKRQMRFMGDGAAFNFIAMEQAIADSGLQKSDISNPRTGLIVGSRRPVHAKPVCRQQYRSGKRRAQADGTVHGHPLHVLHQLGLSGDPL